MEVSQKPPVHAANLVANNGNTVYGVDVIVASAPPRHGWPKFAPTNRGVTHPFNILLSIYDLLLNIQFIVQ